MKCVQDHSAQGLMWGWNCGWSACRMRSTIRRGEGGTAETEGLQRVLWRGRGKPWAVITAGPPSARVTPRPGSLRAHELANARTHLEGH